MSKTIDIRRITLTALMSALIFVLTRTQLSVTPTGGYIHLGDAGIIFASLAFGPWVGMVAGGLGTALADITSGYAQWTIFSLGVHGAQGWAVGRLFTEQRQFVSTILVSIASMAIVVGGYFIAGTLLEGSAIAFGSLLPNVIQSLGGALLGIPLYFAVQRAYPPLRRYRQVQ
ncbi:MAG: ECF transporter S component [Chloroflexota bacterium]|nr:ECF transporter S component [Chloroflexota bacterium]